MSALILASGSQIRKTTLASAGVEFEVRPSRVDEDAIKQAQGHLDPADIACLLAAEKACEVSKTFPDHLVLGADQTMELDGQLLDKLPQRDLARQRLISMRGKMHYLHSGLVLAKNGKPLWELAESSKLYVRDFSDEFLDYYLESAGDELTASVGAYAYEALGAQLFDRVEGDFYSITGLPLLPLMAALRDFGVIRS